VARRIAHEIKNPLTPIQLATERLRRRYGRQIETDPELFDELTSTIREIAPKEVWVTHGREDALLHWCQMHQIKARALDLVGYEDEDD